MRQAYDGFEISGQFGFLKLGCLKLACLHLACLNPGSAEQFERAVGPAARRDVGEFEQTYTRVERRLAQVANIR